MIDSMKKALLAVLTAGAALVAGSPDAHAWLKIRNSSNVTLNVAYAYNAVNGVGCGYYDGCNTFPGPSDPNDWQVQYWYVLAQGSEALVNSHDTNNALHQVYAENPERTLFLQGGGVQFGINRKKGSHCGWADTANHDLTPVFFKITNKRCCGPSCIGFSIANDYKFQIGN